MTDARLEGADDAVLPFAVEALDVRGRSVRLARAVDDLLGRHAEAERSYRQAMALAPDNIAVRNNFAVSLMLTGRAAEAVSVRNA